MISIIIPFYNSERYLQQCIECLLNQSYTDFEAIFVNDGSTDDFQNVFNKLNDDRIILINQNNRGVSSARNNGIKKAKGKYICFLDVDDIYEKNYLKKMVEITHRNKLDVVLCNYTEKYIDHSICIKYKWKNEVLNKNEVIKSFIPTLLSYNNDLKEFNRCLVWRTMIKSDLAKSVKFNENVATAEDLLYLLEIYLKANNIYFLDDSLYIYNRYSGTTLDRFQYDLLKKQIYLHSEIIRILKEYNLYDNLEKLYINNRLKMYTSILSNSVRTNKKNAILLIKELTAFYKKDSIMYNIDISNIKDFLNNFFMKKNMNYLLYFIYSLKEKIRRKKLKGW